MRRPRGRLELGRQQRELLGPRAAAAKRVSKRAMKMEAQKAQELEGLEERKRLAKARLAAREAEVRAKKVERTRMRLTKAAEKRFAQTQAAAIQVQAAARRREACREAAGIRLVTRLAEAGGLGSASAARPFAIALAAAIPASFPGREGRGAANGATVAVGAAAAAGAAA